MMSGCGGASSDKAAATPDDAQMENITTQEPKLIAEEAYLELEKDYNNVVGSRRREMIAIEQFFSRLEAAPT